MFSFAVAAPIRVGHLASSLPCVPGEVFCLFPRPLDPALPEAPNRSNIHVGILEFILRGKHSGNKLGIQEFMIMPVGASTFEEAMEMGVEVYGKLKELVQKQFGADSTNLGQLTNTLTSHSTASTSIDALLSSLSTLSQHLRLFLVYRRDGWFLSQHCQRERSDGLSDERDQRRRVGTPVCPLSLY